MFQHMAADATAVMIPNLPNVRSGACLRRLVPEIARLADRWLHRPWEALPEILEVAGLRPGRDCPGPIFDLAESRRRALAAFEALG